eukprot:1025584-Lingulodinium_polyedra.AAC.1
MRICCTTCMRLHMNARSIACVPSPAPGHGATFELRGCAARPRAKSSLRLVGATRNGSAGSLVNSS